MLVLGLQGNRIEKQQRSIGMRSKDGFSLVSTNSLVAGCWLWCNFGLVVETVFVVVLVVVSVSVGGGGWDDMGWMYYKMVWYNR